MPAVPLPPDATAPAPGDTDAFWFGLCPVLAVATDATRGAALALCLLVLAAVLRPTLGLLRRASPALRGVLTAATVVALAGSLGVVATALDYGARDALRFGVPLLALPLAVPAFGTTPAPVPLPRLLVAALLLVVLGAARAALAPWPLLTQPFAVLVLLALGLAAHAAWRTHHPHHRSP